jgi:NADPH-dependent curcumin reductase CurA
MTTTSRNRRWLLQRRPDGDLREGDLQLVDAPMPQPAHGEIVVRNIYLMVAPTNRVWMSAMDQYMEPVALGSTMRGLSMGQVVDSAHPGFRPGDIVEGVMGWEDYSVTRQARKVALDHGLPLAACASVLGSSGLTAYFGMTDVARPRAGETVVVTAAAGGVGSIATQIARILGCRVVGVAGGARKCAYVTTELGAATCVDYRTGRLADDLRAACPDGIDVEFENVGGEVMDAVMAQLNVHARIAMCGIISSYNAKGDWWAPSRFRDLIMKRVRAEGFLITDYLPRFAEGTAQLAQWVRAGELRYQVDIVDGLERAAEALNRLFCGANLGKQLVRLAPEPAL